MDPRLHIAKTLEMLSDAKMDDTAFWDELNNCQGPDDAIQICVKYRAMASANA